MIPVEDVNNIMLDMNDGHWQRNKDKCERRFPNLWLHGPKDMKHLEVKMPKPAVYCDFLSFQHMPPIRSTSCITFPSMPSSCAFLLRISQLWPGRAHEKTPRLFDNLDIRHRKFFEQHRLKFEAVEMGESGELQKIQLWPKIHTVTFSKTSIYN